MNIGGLVGDEAAPQDDVPAAGSDPTSIRAYMVLRNYDNILKDLRKQSEL